MDTLEKDCSAIGGLFQQIINDMKGSWVVWEDFTNKATKLHSTLKATILATGAFLETFQKVADMATNTRGATREIGSALTRLCMRHKSIEEKLKSFNSGIIDLMVIPMQERLEEWKKSSIQLDKDHAKEYKRAKQEIKRASSDTIRLQKKLRKGGCMTPREEALMGKSDMQTRLDTAMLDVNERFHYLEETEKNAVRKALIEERKRFCLFISYLKPLVDRELLMLTEITHLQEIMDSLCMQAGDPNSLPPASEQAIIDLKGSEQKWNFKQPPSPPSSPSSLGSRKSSMCSISSINSSSSGSTQSHSPSHQLHRPRSQPPPSAVRLSSVSSQDSGFTSQDTLFLRSQSPHVQDFTPKVCDNSSSSGTGTDSNATTPSPSYALPSSTSVSTWSNWPDPPGFNRPETTGPVDRPHTISTAYEKNHLRPALTSHTFEPPDPTILERAPASHTAPVTPSHYAIPCIQNRTKDVKIPPTGPKARGRPVAPPTVPDMSNPEMLPTYVNMSQLANMAVAQRQASLKEAEEGEEEAEEQAEVEKKAPIRENPMNPARNSRSISMPPQYESTPLRRVIEELNTTTAALRNQKRNAEEKAPNSHELAAAIKELEASTAELQKTYTVGHPSSRASIHCSSGYGTLNSTPANSQMMIETSQDADDPELDLPPPPPEIQENYYHTLPRHSIATIPVNGSILRRPVSTAGIPAVHSGVATIRRSSVQPGKPSPPVRRTTSVVGGMMVLPPVVPNNGTGAAVMHRRSQSDASSMSSSSGSLVAEDADSSGEYMSLPPPPDEMLTPSEENQNMLPHSPIGIVGSHSQNQIGILGSHSHNPMGMVGSHSQNPIGMVGSHSQPPIEIVGSHASLIQSLHQQLAVKVPPPNNLSQELDMHVPPSGDDTTPEQPDPSKDSFESYSSDDITPTGDPPQDTLMTQIRRGVSLRRTISYDRSAPRFT